MVELSVVLPYVVGALAIAVVSGIQRGAWWHPEAIENSSSPTARGFHATRNPCITQRCRLADRAAVLDQHASTGSVSYRALARFRVGEIVRQGGRWVRNEQRHGAVLEQHAYVGAGAVAADR
jgi:hypothetical protein